MDRKISLILKILKINDIPIFHLSDKLYFVGLYKLNLELKGDFLLVRLGINQWERLADYIKENREIFKR